MSAHRARRAALAVLAWLAIVALGSTMVWAVVSRAGAGVSDPSGDAPLVGASRGQPQPPTPSSSSRPVRPSTSGGSASPAPAAPARVQDTWSGAGGALVVSCTGARIVLDGAPANDGWSVEVEARGPDRVRVDFEERGEAERETRVEAGCRDGRPAFDIRADR